MCGRFTLRTPASKLVEQFYLPVIADLPPRYNVAPSQAVAAIVRPAGQLSRQLAWLKWGLVPPWADDPAIGNRMINARSETVAEKAAFRKPLAERRCLILADGFYEWHALGKAKQPYFFELKSGEPFAFAGLWEHWRRDEQVIDSCTVLTTSANELLDPYHDRMPVILHPEDYDRWLDPNIKQAADVTPLLKPFPADQMQARPVGTRVNRPVNDDPGCLDPAPGSLF
jgi:putative SOS response-associated peptidase YedK